MHIGIFLQHSIAEELETLVVVVALLTLVRLVVLVSDFQILDVIGLGMSVLGTQGAILTCHGAVGILQRIHRLVDPRLYGIKGSEAAMPDTHVDDIERLSAQVLSELEIFVKAQSVGGAIAPVDIPVAFALLHGTDGTFPTESIIRVLLPLDKTAAGEAQELRMKVVEHTGQLWTQAILPVAESGREE